MEKNDKLDAVHAADRNGGVVGPESGEDSNNVVGRPQGEGQAGFHEGTETLATDRAPFTPSEALDEGGSFDGLGVPVADDSTV